MKLYQHRNNPRVRYWAWQEASGDYEIRTPYRVSPDEETLPPEQSVPSGVMPAAGFEEHYREV